jgi:thymidylate synthase (FAD)
MRIMEEGSLPKVSLVSYNSEGERLVAVAAKLSLSRKPFDYHWKSMTREEVEKWIKECYKRNHLSPFEHSVYTFFIEGMSRVASHQFVRHRIASYTQLSHRFAKPIEEYYKPIVPPSGEARLGDKYKKVMKEIYSLYLEMLKEGLPEEDARYVLPNAVNTNLIVTINARSLLNFFALRTCSRAQWEIRYIAWKMLEEVRKVHPILFKYAGPSCILFENFIRGEPVTVNDVISGIDIISERCVEGVKREGIPKCILNAMALSNNDSQDI